MAKSAFISYASEDETTVLAIAADLGRRGWNVWLDRQRLAAGQQWGHQISTAIAGSQVVLAVISPAALRSQWVDAELQLAVDHDRPVLAVVIGETDLEAVRDHFGLYLSRHWIDFGAVGAVLDGNQFAEIDYALDALAKGASARPPGSLRKTIGTVLAVLGIIGMVASFGWVMVMMAGAFGDFGAFVDALLAGSGGGSTDEIADRFRGYVGSLIEVAVMFVAVFGSIVLTLIGFGMRRSARRKALYPRAA